ncbi:MAG: alpha/beta hydrolase [Bacteroidales bacterium]|nr:alpha/beta hydrolase [Bacteroidales bacterium]
MKSNLLITLLFLINTASFGIQPSEPDTMIYLFPGQGSDERLFKHLVLPAGYDTVHISYPVPDKHETLATYAMRFIDEMDLSAPYILVGVSLGGMICTELSDTLSPLRTILISSAKTTHELPGRYTFQKHFRLNRIIPKRMTKGGARLLQGIVEPDRKHDKETFKDMLKAKDPLYLKRTVDMIINWDRTSYSDKIIHIHGDKDHTIPIKNVRYDYLMEEGSHMMMITRAGEINQIIDHILNQ